MAGALPGLQLRSGLGHATHRVAAAGQGDQYAEFEEGQDLLHCVGVAPAEHHLRVCHLADS